MKIMNDMPRTRQNFGENWGKLEKIDENWDEMRAEMHTTRKIQGYIVH